MENQQFVKLSAQEAKDIYGGWKLLALALPFIIKSIITAVVSFKSIMSDQGLIKTDGVEAKWNNESEVKKTTPTKTVYYAY